MREIDIHKGNGVFSVNGLSDIAAEEKPYLNGESFNIGRSTVNPGDVLGYEKKDIDGHEMEYLWRIHGTGDTKRDIELMEISEVGRGPDLGAKVQELQRNGAIYLNGHTNGSKMPMIEVLEGSKDELLNRRQLSRETLDKLDEPVFGNNKNVKTFGVSDKDPEDFIKKQNTPSKKVNNDLSM